MTVHSRILACDFSVGSEDGLIERLSENNHRLARLGAQHLVVYRALAETRRVFTTLGLHDRGSIDTLMRAPGVMKWFDNAGVDQIPPLFAGEMVAKVESETLASEDWGIIVAAIAPVHDVPKLIDNVRNSIRRFASAGVRRVWIYQAFDDRQEVMILQELDSEDHANAWVAHPDSAAEWMAGAGVGLYPPLFVGKLEQVINVQSTQ